ncbi:MAG: SDR family NAD(P)-dependent oxidoreductase, partial [Cyclobacteriaceae bacterium]
MPDLKGKVAVVTGGGGVLCGELAKLLALNGAKVAILDLKKEAADQVADEIIKAGGEAIGVAANVLEKEALEIARKEVEDHFGTCDILLNGAGGNHPKGTTTKEFFEEDQLLDNEITSFFDLDPKGIEFV